MTMTNTKINDEKRCGGISVARASIRRSKRKIPIDAMAEIIWFSVREEINVPIEINSAP